MHNLVNSEGKATQFVTGFCMIHLLNELYRFREITLIATHLQNQMLVVDKLSNCVRYPFLAIFTARIL